jgi:hypothetical protein
MVIFVVILVLMLLSVFTRTNAINTQIINNLNATVGQGQRSVHLMTFTADDTTKTLQVVVPSLTCATEVNWSILPRASGGGDEVATIKIGTTAGDDDFGQETVAAADVAGTITNGSTPVKTCNTPTSGTAVLYFTVEVTAGAPATFLFEVVTTGVFNVLNS